MKTLFHNQARYPDMDAGYGLYLRRSTRTPKERILSKAQYSRIVKRYCKELANVLEATGFVDLPSNIGSLVAVKVRKKPKWDKQKQCYRSADNVDYEATRKSGHVVRTDCRDTFGITFVPKSDGKKKTEIFQCFGIRANKALYKRMKKKYDNGELGFPLPDIEDLRP